MGNDDEIPLTILTNTNKKNPEVQVKTEIDKLLSHFKSLSNEQNKLETLKPLSSIIPATRQPGNRDKPDEKSLIEQEIERQKYMPYEHSKRNHHDNFNYVKKRGKTEKKIRNENSNMSVESSEKMDFNDVKPDEDYCDDFDLNIYNDPIYNFFGHKYDARLPIFKIKDEILDSLFKTNIVIIQGNTGCGKTTQVSQMILDFHARQQTKCKIIITQPRRLAATSISRRVCDERKWELGSICGYKIALDKKCSKYTKIFYVTTGHLLQEIITDTNALNTYTHIILDEIHDRELDTDLIILFIKILLLKGYKGKIVLMSATLESTTFAEYFKNVSSIWPIPVLKCSTNMHKVHEYYLDNLNQYPSYQPIEFKKDESELYDELLPLLGDLLRDFDKNEIKYQEPRSTINGFASERGAVLIFVPGMEEINRVERYLREYLSEDNLITIPLHSEIPYEQQRRAFDRAPGGVRKVIISTSIAESSITVPDTKYVIDFCLTKSLFNDISTNYTSLKREWASKSSMDQRKGRAGRISSGICYRLVEKSFYDSLDDHPQPAILRQPIDKLLLRVKQFTGSLKPVEALSMALAPPPLDNIERTILHLKEIGALSLYKNGKYCVDDGDLTFAGQVMCQLPVDLRLGKLILFGYAFGKLREGIVLAAALSVKSIFKSYYKSYLEANGGKLKWARGLFCDYTCIIHAYDVWRNEVKKNRNFRSREEQRKWAESNMLNLDGLIEMEKLKIDIEKSLENFNVFYDKGSTFLNPKDVNNEEDAIDEYYLLKLMVAGAFYPSYYKTNLPDLDQCQRLLSCKDPKSSVCVKGFKDDAFLYHNQIKKLFSCCCKDIILHYEVNKAILEFKVFDDIVNYGLYKAVIMGKLRNFNLYLPRCVYTRETQKIVTDVGNYRHIESRNYEMNTQRMTTGLQDKLEDANRLLGNLNEFEIKIIEVTKLGHFWAQIADSQKNLERITERLNTCGPKLKPLPDPDKLSIGQLVVTIHIDVNYNCEFHRAKICEINAHGVKVLFIDYGNVEEKDFELLFEIPDELKDIPYQAFEAELINLRINPFKQMEGIIMDKSIVEFSKRLQCRLKAKVFSIVENVVRLSLIDISSQIYEKDISIDLIKIGLFEKCDESEQSKLKNRLRMNENKVKSQNNRSKNEWISIGDLEKRLESLEFNKHEPFEIKIESPILCTLDSMTRSSRNKYRRYVVDKDSVNYAILDVEPNVRCSSLLVARKNDIGEKEDRLILRNTCLFRKIRGIVSLCLLMFAPIVEMRTKKGANRYTGALCGLGFNAKTKKPLYTENDIEDVFEIKFDDKDLKQINVLRHCINMLIGEKFKSRAEYDQLVKHTKTCILELLNKEKVEIEEAERYHVEKEYFWEQLPPNAQYYLTKNNKSVRKMKNDFFYTDIKAIDFSKI